MRYLAEMTFAEVQEAAKDAVVLLPAAATEAHGPHLPLMTDVIIARAMATAGAKALEARGVSLGVVAPPLQWTPAGYAAGFPGTMSLSPSTATAVLVEALMSFHRAGFSRIVVANAHLDPAHIASLNEGVSRARDAGAVVTFPDITRKPWALRLTDEFRSGACHAGQFETSIIMAERPDLVRETIRVALEPNPASLSDAIRAGKATFEAAGGPEAYFGYPAKATPEEGRETLRILGEILADAVASDREEGVTREIRR